MRDRESNVTPSTRVRLTAAAQARFPDIGARVGTVVAVDGWAVVRFDRMEVRVPVGDLEICDGS